MRFTFHTFTMGDVDDPEIYAAFPIHEWEGSEQGQWVMEHAVNPRFFINSDHNNWGYRVDIVGDIEPGPALTEYLLKWHKKEQH